MSDIRFNQWLHQSGTGGVSQSDGGHVGIGTTNPLLPVGAGNTHILHVGVVTSNSISAGSSITATTFYGSGANLTSLSSANLTGTLPAISGANLTSLPAQATIANNADNRVITGGSGVNLNGEANLLFDGTELKIGGDSSVAGTFGLEVYNTASNEGTALIAGTQGARLDIMDTGSSERIRISASGAIYFISYKSGDDIIFQNTTGSGTAERFRVKTDGIKVTSANANGSAIQMYNTDSSANVWYVNGEGDSFQGNTYPRTDSNLDLGYHATNKWRDVVLSGGIRYGNASDANYLDDYEEGSWTPQVLNGWGILNPTYSEQAGVFVKVGKLVHVTFRIKLNGGSTNGNRVAVSGFPFSAATIGTSGYANGGYAALNGYCDSASSNAQSVFCMVGRSGTTAELFHRNSTGESSFTGSELGASGSSFNFSGTYTTP